ncbi:hypothetical protein [Frigidibacter mobilis]|uniref:Uncharacterized protein n=1 Tax=Frigidibacter mobilis TaxID=1335048 RepID=A0A159Z9D3_9RHOB|nr:hypothetical protein [Frigidibacter mobilis]AMY72161.1 hypothetical protein AKL17_3p0005 [Frigidibacter mobilis]
MTTRLRSRLDERPVAGQGLFNNIRIDFHTTIGQEAAKAIAILAM